MPLVRYRVNVAQLLAGPQLFELGGHALDDHFGVWLRERFIVMMGYNENPKNSNQNMATDRTCIAPFSTKMASLKSWESELFNDVIFIQNRVI